MDAHTLATRIAVELTTESFPDVKTSPGSDSRYAVQFKLVPESEYDLYYRSVVEVMPDQEGAYVSRYEFRLPNWNLDDYYRDGVEFEAKQLVRDAATDEISDWAVNINETNAGWAPHVESFYGPEDAPTYRAVVAYATELRTNIQTYW